MAPFATSIDPAALPAISDSEGLEKLDDFLASLAELTDEPVDLLQAPANRPLLEAIFSNSPFLAHCMTADPAFAAHLLDVGPDNARDQLFSQLTEQLPNTVDTPTFMKLLRQAKRQIALLTAVADIATVWPLEMVTAALSHFANIAVDYAVAHLTRQAMVRGDIAWPGQEDAPATPDLARDAGYFVLAMGKLGADELNYSSDIDLICFFEHDRVPYQGRKTAQDCLVRLTRDLVKVLQERTGDGYVFRVDLRLRPDASATPAAMSTEAAEIYYQSLGLNWERSAMIKARTMAGDMEAGDAFLHRLAPFVWRKSLDFAALDDIRSMKDRIHAHHGHDDIGVEGHDVKLGPGGIREIEFFVQSQQLISGGRNPALRDNRTVPMLSIMVDQGLIDPQVQCELRDAYDFLRRLEHRLQMVRDEQTHTMPDDAAAVQAIANFMAFESVDAFRETMMRHLATVHGHFNGLFRGGDSDDDDDTASLLLGGTDDTKEAGQTLQAFGFKDADHAAEIVARWGSPRYRACRSDRSQALLRDLLPTILHALAKTSEPDIALLRFDEFLSRLPSGVQMFSLFQSNPKLLELFGHIVGSAPVLSAMISRSSVLFDAVLDSGFFAEMPDQEELKKSLDTSLAQARDFQDVLDITRRWVNERRFQIGVKTLQGALDAEAGFAINTDLAEVSTSALFPAVADEFAAQHGVIADGGMATIAMGSFGGIETSFTSDLDMIFVYDVSDLDRQSDGRKPLSANQYFARLSQRFINAITAQTSEGRLYEVDMRLRPSGNAGPIALSLEAFAGYQQKQAWTWEHMALTRARVVGGPKALRQGVEETIRNALSVRRDPDKLLLDVAKMRERLADEFSEDNPWQVKHVRGGLVDVEFIAQFMQLLHACDHPEILQPHTVTALAALNATGILPDSDSDLLIDAAKTYGAIRGFVRQIIGDNADPLSSSKDMQDTLARMAGAENITALQRSLMDQQKQVLALFTQLIASPASAIEKATIDTQEDTAE